MALKNFNCNLNGGDSVTPNNDLTYKFYGADDSYASVIATKGSHTTDADVTVTGDVVVLLNVNIGDDVTFKISSVDANGNESPLSDAKGGSILFQDNFTGTTIDTAKWDVATVTNSSITQNDEALLHIDPSVASVSFGEVELTSKYLVDFTSGARYLKFDFSNNLTNKAFYMGLFDGTDYNNRIIVGTASPTSTTAYRLLTYDGASSNSVTINENLIAGKSFKFKLESTRIEMFAYETGAWVSKLVVTTNLPGTSMYIFMSMAGTNGSTIDYTLDDVYVTDTDFSTLNPS